MAKDQQYIQEGGAAYWNGESYDDPPYEQRDFRCLDWQQGWRQAKAADDRGEVPDNEMADSFLDMMHGWPHDDEEPADPEDDAETRNWNEQHAYEPHDRFLDDDFYY